jgi:hypothetical protein
MQMSQLERGALQLVLLPWKRKLEGRSTYAGIAYQTQYEIPRTAFMCAVRPKPTTSLHIEMELSDPNKYI